MSEVRFYEIGDALIRYEGPAFREREYVSVFRVEDRKHDADLSYRVIPNDEICVPEERCIYKDENFWTYGTDEKRSRVMYSDEQNEIWIKDKKISPVEHEVEISKDILDNFGSHLWIKILDLPHEMLLKGAIFLHASYIIWNGQAILFTAPKQIGKSTQARLWNEVNGAQIINGDRALLKKKGNQWFVYGSPYCGTSKICHNVTSPLKAIVILSQRKENFIRPANTMESLMSLLDGCSYQTWNKKEVGKVMELANDLILNIPFYKLECLPDEGAVKILEEVLCP